MPQQTDIEYLDGTIIVSEEEPSTIAECVALIGESAVVDETTSNLRYRNKYPRVYKKASAEIVGEFPRAVKETKTNKDGTEKKILISENDHLRQFAAVSDENKAKLAEIITRIAQSESLYVKGERTGGGGKVSQAALDAANGFFAAGDEVVEDKIMKIESLVPGYKVSRDSEGNATAESVARGIMALNKHIEAQSRKAAQAALA